MKKRGSLAFVEEASPIKSSNNDDNYIIATAVEYVPSGKQPSRGQALDSYEKDSFKDKKTNKNTYTDPMNQYKDEKGLARKSSFSLTKDKDDKSSIRKQSILLETTTKKSKSWPLALTSLISKNLDRPINEVSLRKYLVRQKWPKGLQDILIK